MPIEKVPVIHKFGILSHSHQIDLQERIKLKTQSEIRYSPKKR